MDLDGRAWPGLVLPCLCNANPFPHFALFCTFRHLRSTLPTVAAWAGPALPLQEPTHSPVSSFSGREWERRPEGFRTRSAKRRGGSSTSSGERRESATYLVDSPPLIEVSPLPNSDLFSIRQQIRKIGFTFIALGLPSLCHITRLKHAGLPGRDVVEAIRDGVIPGVIQHLLAPPHGER